IFYGFGFFCGTTRLDMLQRSVWDFSPTGLHQLIFHPVFAFPFIIRLWTSGRRRLALTCLFSYAVICLFWIGYWQIVLMWQGLSPAVSGDVGLLFFLVRAASLLASFHWTGVGLMLKNILRFIVWQNPILLPLLVVAYRAVRVGNGIAYELYAGVILT